jgi:hypothetical protein
MARLLAAGNVVPALPPEKANAVAVWVDRL